MAPAPAANAHGPALIGIFVNAVLYGIVLMQAMTYMQTCQRDPLWMKIYVAALVLADTLSTAFLQAWIYNVLVMRFTDITVLLELDWLLATDPAMVGIIAFMTQTFFAWRIKKLSKSYIIPIFIVLVSLFGCVSSIVFSASFATYPSLLSLATEQSARLLAALWLIPAVVADIAITAAITWNLNSSRTGLAKTEGILNRLIRLTIQNGLLTTSVALVDLITFLAMPNSGIHIGFSVPITKLYTNSVLSGLTSRQSIQRDLNNQAKSVSGGWSTGTVTRSAAPEVYINVDTERSVQGQEYEMGKRAQNWAPATKANMIG